MSHNSTNQEIEFFLSFLNSEIKGDKRYRSIIESLLHDAKDLAMGKSIYDVDKTSISLKILIERFAHDWLLRADIQHLSTGDLSQLREIINEHQNFAFA